MLYLNHSMVIKSRISVIFYFIIFIDINCYDNMYIKNIKVKFYIFI